VEEIMRIGTSLPRPARATHAAPKSKPTKVPGAKLEVLAGDRTQQLVVAGGGDKVCPSGQAGQIQILGKASGRQQAGDGMQNLWLGIFRFTRPDNGKTDHVGGLNVWAPTKPGQTALETAQILADKINAAHRPYEAKVTGAGDNATLTVVYKEHKY
jgi:hypothetical protein